MHRLFVAIRPPEAIRDQLLDLMHGIDDARWQSDEQLHLTLRFIGEVERPQAEDIAAALAALRFAPFALRLNGVGRFAHRKGGALWAGVAPREPLAHLASKVDRACVSAGIAPERRSYHPHLTLARWSRSEPALDAFLHQHAALSSEPWPVEQFDLYESQLTRGGAHYELICRQKATSPPPA